MTSRHFKTSALMALLVAAAPVFSQVTQTTGAIRGIVSSKQGAFIEGATLTLTSKETGQTRTVVTDMLGYYSLPFLPIGSYEITVNAKGHKTIKEGRIRVNLGQTNTLTFDMDAAVAEATVEVVAVNAQIDTERASSATLLTTDSLTNLPVSGRKWESFAFLAPGVTTSTQRGDIAIGGQRGVNTTINVDGGNYNSSFFGGTLGQEAGGTPFTLSSEAIREFQVITDGASAEFGRMGGGYLNAITKNGTNEFTGSVFYYQRPQNLVAKRHSDGKPSPDFSNKQFGATVGGPILKDKLFYFVAIDLQRDDRPNPVTFGPSAASPITLLPGTPANDALLSRNASYTTHNNLDSIFARLDWYLNPNQNLQFRVNHSKFSGDNNSGFNRTYDDTSLEEGKTTSVVGQWTWTINPSWMNEVRVNQVKEELPRIARTGQAQVAITAVGTYGQNQFNRAFETKNTQFSDVVTFISGNLQIRAGGDLTITDVFETFTPTAAGSYSFSSLTNFQAGNWTSYTQFFSAQPGVSTAQAGTLDVKEKEQSLFVQADYHTTTTLKLGLGLRWDRQEHPDFPIANFRDLTPVTGTADPNDYKVGVSGKIPTDSQISPRVSFTWTPDFDKGKTVIRGSAGLYVSRTPSVFIYQVYTANGQRTASIRFTSTTAFATAYPSFTRGATFNWNHPFQFPDNAYSSNPGLFVTAPPALQTFDPDFKNPRTKRVNLGADRAFDSGWTFGFSTDFSRANNLERIQDVNLKVLGTNDQGRVIYGNTGTPNAPTTSLLRPNTAYQSMQLYKSDAEGTYQALSITAKYLKEDSPIKGQLSYTYAKERDNDSNERSFSGFTTADTNNLNGDYSWSANDRRNVITGFLSVYDKWYSGIVTGFNLRYLSGLAYNPVYTTDRNADGVTNNDRPLGIARNAYREPGRTIIDVKLSREFTFGRVLKLQFSAEVFNLFNKVTRYTRTNNYTTTVTNDASYTINPAVVATSTERQVQLGARFSF